MKYKVLKSGLSQNIDGQYTEPAIDDVIEVSDEAAAVLVPEGYLEKLEEPPAPRRRRKVEATAGFDGVVTEPTTILTGEAGPERVEIKPAEEGD